MDQKTTERVAAIRAFNRFYTRQIRVLGQGILDSPYSLTQVRILYELAHQRNLTATALCRDLDLDAGLVSRLLAGMERHGLVSRIRSRQDGRQRLLRLTARGRKEFAPLNRRASQEIAEWLASLGEHEQEQLLRAMGKIECTLQTPGEGRITAFRLRPHGPGDMGWVVHRHGALYAAEYGFDETFEALVAQIVSNFVTNFQPERERCWIAEMNREIVGSVFCVRADDTTAKLRLLLVEPQARGMGLGGRLVRECIDFARGAGYKKLILWTNSILVEARHLYEQAGFQLLAQDPHHSFGHDLIGENWELALTR